MAVFGLPGGPELMIIAIVLLVLGVPAAIVGVVVWLLNSKNRAASAAGVVPAGWLPDPTGKHEQRYWNGVTWTLHVADAGVQSVDPM